MQESLESEVSHKKYVKAKKTRMQQEERQEIKTESCDMGDTRATREECEKEFEELCAGIYGLSLSRESAIENCVAATTGGMDEEQSGNAQLRGRRVGVVVTNRQYGQTIANGTVVTVEEQLEEQIDFESLKQFFCAMSPDEQCEFRRRVELFTLDPTRKREWERELPQLQWEFEQRRIRRDAAVAREFAEKAKGAVVPPPPSQQSQDAGGREYDGTTASGQDVLFSELLAGLIDEWCQQSPEKAQEIRTAFTPNTSSIFYRANQLINHRFEQKPIGPVTETRIDTSNEKGDSKSSKRFRSEYK